MSRAAAMVWSAIAEPTDEAACWLVDRLGAEAALAWVRAAAEDPVSATAALGAAPAQADAAIRAVPRWSPRLDHADPGELAERAEALGAWVVTPDEPGWPAALADLGPEGAPFALWVRGRPGFDLDAVWSRSLAVVGSRAATAYGLHCASEIAAAAAERGITVISGGAYGIDAAAHRGALAAGGETVAILAGGVDRLYPRGNEPLLERIVETAAVVSEQPPGFAPHRSRFLSRNRLIAAAGATVVVEAAWRSGALSTAAHAARMVRPVGAVPGPMTAASSSGCHRLVREGQATLLSAPADALELVLSFAEAPAAAHDEDGGAGVDFASANERRVFGALPRLGAGTDAVAVAAGLTAGEALRALGGLAARGLVESREGTWRRVVRGSPR